MRVLFLGENRSRFSSVCLEALLVSGCGHMTVGIGGWTFQAWWRRVARGLRQRGVWRELIAAAGRAWHQGAAFCGQFNGRGPGMLSLHRLLAEHEGTPHYRVRAVNAPEHLARLRALAPDVIFTAGFTQILGPAVIQLPPLGCINLHPSLLPGYRGLRPLRRVLENREKVTGVSLHYVDSGIDTGDLIAQEIVPIEPGDDERCLFARCAPVAARLMVTTARRLAEGERLPRRPQGEQVATAL